MLVSAAVSEDGELVVFIAAAPGFGGRHARLSLEGAGISASVFARTPLDPEAEQGVECEVEAHLSDDLNCACEGPCGEGEVCEGGVCGPVEPGCGEQDLGSAIGSAVARGATVFGTPSAFGGSCGGGGAPEALFAWTAPRAGQFTFDLGGSSFDTVLHLRDGACEGPELACNDDGIGLQSSVTLPLALDQRVVIVVDGFGAGAGAFTLNILAQDACDDGQDNDGDGAFDCEDPDCAQDPICVVEICDNGQDDDGDGAFDCLDADCLNDPACPPCNGIEMGSALGRGLLEGDIDAEAPSDFEPGFCGGADGQPEEVFRWTAPFAGYFDFEATGSDPNMAIVHLRDEFCVINLGCVGNFGQPRYRFEMAEGQTVNFIIEAFLPEVHYVLSILPSEFTLQNCDNGLDDDEDGLTDCDDDDCFQALACR